MLTDLTYAAYLNQGLVWKLVKGNTLDNFFDRGGGMSPVLASTLNVRYADGC
jgi:hypothetical protein